MGYKLFLDDQRGEPQGWTLVSSFDEFVNIIKENGLPNHIAFDHDLWNVYNPETEECEFHEGAKTGFDCAKWLVDNNLIPKQFSVHSHSGSAHRIGMLMEESGSKCVESPFPYRSTFKPKEEK